MRFFCIHIRPAQSSFDLGCGTHPMMETNALAEAQLQPPPIPLRKAGLPECFILSERLVASKFSQPNELRMSEFENSPGLVGVQVLLVG